MTGATSTATPQARLAEKGSFFLLNRVSVTTNSGVTGYAPGTKVKYLRTEGDKVRVTDGHDEFVVARNQLTNDLKIAATVARRDLQAQSAVSRQIQQRLGAAHSETGGRVELARLKAQLNQLKLEKIKLEHVITEAPQGTRADSITLKKQTSLNGEIARTQDRIQELTLQLQADEATRNPGR